MLTPALMLSPALALAAHLLIAAPPAHPGPIQWIHNDWDRAAAQAKAEGKTVAVDVWATWCHTCLSMTNYVFTDPKMSKVADQHVWLALDYDLEKNAAFFERHPASAFPTFLVLDPKNEALIARWAGSGTADEMLRFFSNAQAGDEALAKGQRALAQKRFGEARTIFEAALSRKNELQIHTRLLLGWVEALYNSDKTACAVQGSSRLSEAKNNAQGGDFASLVAYCALSLRDEPTKKAALHKVVARLEPIVNDPMAPIAVDDRSSFYGILQDAYEALGQDKQAHAAVLRRLQLLEGAAKEAKTPAGRATFDYHRMQAYLHLGRSKDAVRMLKASEKAQPKDFNHPWRLAKVYLQTKDYSAGLAAIDRALSKGYGGRKLRLFSTKIDLLLAAKKTKAARATAAAGQAHLRSMSAAQVRPFWRAEFEGRAKKAHETSS